MAFGTGRRDGLTVFTALVAQAGLAPVRVSYANSLLAPAVVVVRLLQRWGVAPFSQDLYDEGAVNRLLGWALRTEARWLRRRNLPWGASLFVVAQRAMERG